MQPTSWKAIALVLAGIVLGCAADVVRAVHAFAPSPTATVWQQYCQDAENHEEANQRVQAAGAQGFELVSASVLHSNTDDLLICFKRPAP